ncbi:MAG: class I SAM-dependent methyltransferase [Polaromonas sp.]
MSPQMTALSPEQTLDDVPFTLLIPLAARAFGDAMFPAMAVHDAYAASALRSLDTDISHFLEDRPSVYGVLSRTRIFCDLAREFFSRFPQALGANLGCGLTCYFQWLDRRSNRWLDADLPQVMALRKQLLPAGGKRLHHADVDLSQPGWWDKLDLPHKRVEVPVLLICEGVLMYLEPAQVQCVLREFGENAPAGSELLFDSLCWLAVGCAALHPSVRHTNAQFRWGPSCLADFTAPHPRLVLRSEHAVMDEYGFALSLIDASFRAMYGVPMYGITRLGVVA